MVSLIPSILCATIFPALPDALPLFLGEPSSFISLAVIPVEGVQGPVHIYFRLSAL
jgi:hypothetical protein